ncbi:DUF6185 family protein [Paractinoplanes globisporus]|uniref:DUF6185 family protein n=1 Tax=Paractinoplanes globisporus TaxID=113565 RepID=A0ABW6WX15_9ACTN|nr:DUF6185 family protein [Actinoplanes globisporus]
MRARRRILQTVAILAAAAVSLCLPSAAHAQPSCPSLPPDVHTRAALELAAKGVDDIRWNTSYSAVVPASWLWSGRLLSPAEADEFVEAVACLLPLGSIDVEPEQVSVSRTKDGIAVMLPTSGDLYGFDFPPDGPWELDETRTVRSLGKGKWAMMLRTGGDVAPFFNDVVVTAKGLRLSEPWPLPASATATRLEWIRAGAGNTSTLAFDVDPPSWRRMQQFVVSDSGYGEDAPLDVEVLVCCLAILVILRQLRKAGDSADRRTADAVSAMRRRRLGVTAAVLVVLNMRYVAFDVMSQVPALPELSYSWINVTVRGLVLIVVATVLIPPNRRWVRRTVLISTSIVVAFAAYFYPAEMLLNGLGWPAAILLLGWVTSGLLPNGGPKNARELGHRVAIALLLLGVAVLGAPSVWSAALVFNLAPVIVAVGLMITVADRRRRIPVLLDRTDCLLVALAAGLLTLQVLPTHYLGLSISVATPALVICLYVAMRLPGVLLRRADVESHLAGDVGDLSRLQTRLMNAEERLENVEKQISTLDAAPYQATHDDLRRELVRRAEKLRSWELSDEPHPQPLPATPGLFAKVRFAVRRSAPQAPEVPAPVVVDPLPPGIRPVDLALVLGPRASAGRNARTVMRFGLLPVLVCAGIQWGQEELGPNFKSDRWWDSTLSGPSHLADVVAFWLMPLFVLGLAWGCLPGRRGAGRALTVWVPFALAMGSAWLIPRLLALAPAGRWVFFTSLLLFALLLAALAADLTTLRQLSGRTRPSASVARFYGVNKLVTALGLLIPLLASGLTIWAQIQKGVLEQPAPQQETRTTGTATPTP